MRSEAVKSLTATANAQENPGLYPVVLIITFMYITVRKLQSAFQ